jgi:gluconokinase
MIIVLMGVAGCGKTTVGKMLSASLDWQFIDADDFHPAENVDKMTRGIPLDDADRWPWLEKMRSLMQDNLNSDRSAVVACSALKEIYRSLLLTDKRVRLVYLKGAYGLIASRLHERADHYMNPELLRSQFATLEEPADVLTVDAALSPEMIVDKIKREFRLTT